MKRAVYTRGRVYDLDTGTEVKGVLWVDTDTGQLEAYQLDSHGRPVSGGGGTLLTYRAAGRFKFVEDRPVLRTSHLGAPQCEKCGSKLTLLGDDLCARCRAKERGQKHTMVAVPLSTPLFDAKCSRCSRRASWCVADEVVATPERVGSILFSRAAVVGRRFYCSWCWKAPRILDAKGEVVKHLEEEARP